MKFFKASYESVNFNFEGYGKSKAEALKTLRAALKIHTKQYELERGWFEADDFNVEYIEFGIPYRDNDTMD